MNPRTELVMNRHRELKAEGLTGLEASRVVLKEAEEGTLGVTKPVTKRNNVTPVTKRGGAGNEPISREVKTGKTAGSTPARLHQGRPKKHADHAARQRAYRERSRG